MLVIAFKPGRLANRLILYANFVAYVTEYGGVLLNPSFDEYSPYFKNTAFNSLGMFPKKLSLAYHPQINRLIYRVILLVCRIAIRTKFRTKLIDYLYLDLDDSFDLNNHLTISKSKIVFVHGWLFRANTLLKKHQVLVRKVFEPVASIKQPVEVFIQRQRKEADILVGIHVRRGDYRIFKDGAYYYSNEQYLSLMRQMKKCIPDKRVRFIICSDEVLDGFQCQELDWTLSTNHLVEDLYILSECDYIVGPPSTYSTWASFYGRVPLYHIVDPDKSIELTSFKIDLLA